MKELRDDELKEKAKKAKSDPEFAKSEWTRLANDMKSWK